MESCGTPLKIIKKSHQNYCKNHSPLFCTSLFQGKVLKSIEYRAEKNLIYE